MGASWIGNGLRGDGRPVWHDGLMFGLFSAGVCALARTVIADELPIWASDSRSGFSIGFCPSRSDLPGPSLVASLALLKPSESYCVRIIRPGTAPRCRIPRSAARKDGP
jgi:hypothetical protein